MPFYIVEGDITKMDTDAIVNAANNSLLGGGGVDGAIHRAAGPELLEECRTFHGCPTGKAKITKGYKLPCKNIIHTVGPIWYGGNNNEEELLRSCYKNSLELAKENGLKSISFPLISSGIYGYPKDQAYKVAADTIKEFLDENDMDIYLVFFNKDSADLDLDFIEDLNNFINENYVDYFRAPSVEQNYSVVSDLDVLNSQVSQKSIEIQELDELINQKKEGFSEMLLRKIEESGMTDPECYKKANIDRRLFSKIKNNKDYLPSKDTVLSLAVALELPIEETEKLLMKAGFALSNSQLSDVIIKYFIENGIYNIFTINEALFYFNQKLLGI